MKKIAIDVMGNDNGVEPAVLAALEFSRRNLDYTFTLVGDKKQINRYLKETERIQILDVKKTVDNTKDIRAARRDETSMSATVKMLQQNQVDAIISSGNSGLYLAMATLMIKRIPGVKRPAFMPIFPTIVENKKFVMMDVGANIDTTVEMLVQWAKIGAIFSNQVLGILKPKVAIVNIGTEPDKGKPIHQEAYKILKKDRNLNFVGFVEPRVLINGAVDVAISDGYAGNMVLKSMEGSMLGLLHLLKSSIRKKLIYKLGALLSRGAFRKVAQTLDYRNVGAAWVIGLDGIVIKCHGGADKKSFLGAFNQVALALDNDGLTKLKKGFHD